MRKPTAIFLICIFTFSLYARQLSYLECKLSNTLRSSSLPCDCEKKTGLVKDDQKSRDPKAHLHVHLDELFSIPEYKTMVPGLYGLSTQRGEYTDEECEGNFPLPWQPPNS